MYSSSRLGGNRGQSRNCKCDCSNPAAVDFTDLISNLNPAEQTALCDAVIAAGCDLTQLVDLTQLLTMLDPTNCQLIFQCIIDNSTQAQFEEFCGKMGVILNVSTGPDNDPANATSTATAEWGETLHFYSPDNSILYTVTEGSVIIGAQLNPTVLAGIAHTAITNIDLKPAIDGNGNPLINNYTVEITWVDGDGVTHVTTDPTPIIIQTVPDTNYANTDLTSIANRTHSWNHNQTENFDGGSHERNYEISAVFGAGTHEITENTSGRVVEATSGNPNGTSVEERLQSGNGYNRTATSGASESEINQTDGTVDLRVENINTSDAERSQLKLEGSEQGFTLEHQSSEFLNGTTVGIDGKTIPDGGNGASTELFVRTGDVGRGAASTGQVLTLVDPITGEVEYQNLDSIKNIECYVNNNGIDQIESIDNGGIPIADASFQWVAGEDGTAQNIRIRFDETNNPPTLSYEVTLDVFKDGNPYKTLTATVQGGGFSDGHFGQLDFEFGSTYLFVPSTTAPSVTIFGTTSPLSNFSTPQATWVTDPGDGSLPMVEIIMPGRDTFSVRTDSNGIVTACDENNQEVPFDSSWIKCNEVFTDNQLEILQATIDNIEDTSTCPDLDFNTKVEYSDIMSQSGPSAGEPGSFVEIPSNIILHSPGSAIGSIVSAPVEYRLLNGETITGTLTAERLFDNDEGTLTLNVNGGLNISDRGGYRVVITLDTHPKDTNGVGLYSFHARMTSFGAESFVLADPDDTPADIYRRLNNAPQIPAPYPLSFGGANNGVASLVWQNKTSISFVMNGANNVGAGVNLGLVEGPGLKEIPICETLASLQNQINDLPEHPNAGYAFCGDIIPVINNGGPIAGPNPVIVGTFTPHANGDYRIDYSSEEIQGGATPSSGMTIRILSGADVYVTDPATGDADGSRLSPTRLENFVIVSLEEGVEYEIVRWSGGGSSSLNSTTCIAEERLAEYVVQNTSSGSIVGETSTALIDNDDQSYTYTNELGAVENVHTGFIDKCYVESGTAVDAIAASKYNNTGGTSTGQIAHQAWIGVEYRVDLSDFTAPLIADQTNNDWYLEEVILTRGSSPFNASNNFNLQITDAQGNIKGTSTGGVLTNSGPTVFTFNPNDEIKPEPTDVWRFVGVANQQGVLQWFPDVDGRWTFSNDDPTLDGGGNGFPPNFIDANSSLEMEFYFEQVPLISHKVREYTDGTLHQLNTDGNTTDTILASIPTGWVEVVCEADYYLASTKCYDTGVVDVNADYTVPFTISNLDQTTLPPAPAGPNIPPNNLFSPRLDGSDGGQIYTNYEIDGLTLVYVATATGGDDGIFNVPGLGNTPTYVQESNRVVATWMAAPNTLVSATTDYRLDFTGSHVGNLLVNADTAGNQILVSGGAAGNEVHGQIIGRVQPNVKQIVRTFVDKNGVYPDMVLDADDNAIIVDPSWTEVSCLSDLDESRITELAKELDCNSPVTKVEIDYPGNIDEADNYYLNPNAGTIPGPERTEQGILDWLTTNNIDVTTGTLTQINSFDAQDQSTPGQTDISQTEAWVFVSESTTLEWTLTGWGSMYIYVDECGCSEEVLQGFETQSGGTATPTISFSLDPGLHKVRVLNVDHDGQSSSVTYTGDLVNFFAPSAGDVIAKLVDLEQDCDGNLFNTDGTSFTGIVANQGSFSCPMGIKVKADDVVGLKSCDYIEAQSDNIVTVEMPDPYTLVNPYDVTITNSDGTIGTFGRNANAQTTTADQAIEWATAFTNDTDIPGTWTANGNTIEATFAVGDVYPTGINTFVDNQLVFNSNFNPIETVPNLEWQRTQRDLTGTITLATPHPNNGPSNGAGIIPGASEANTPAVLSISSTYPGWVAPDRLKIQIQDLDIGPGEFIDFSLLPDNIEGVANNPNWTQTGTRIDPTANNVSIIATFEGGITTVDAQQRVFTGGTNRVGYREFIAEWDFVSNVTISQGAIIKLIRCGLNEFTDLDGNPVLPPANFVSCGTYNAINSQPSWIINSPGTAGQVLTANGDGTASWV